MSRKTLVFSATAAVVVLSTFALSAPARAGDVIWVRKSAPLHSRHHGNPLRFSPWESSIRQSAGALPAGSLPETLVKRGALASNDASRINPISPRNCGSQHETSEECLRYFNAVAIRKSAAAAPLPRKSKKLSF